jgi:hypothetical protein
MCNLQGRKDTKVNGRFLGMRKQKGRSSRGDKKGECDQNMLYVYMEMS